MGIFTIIGIVVVILWIIGLIGHIGGGLINILLVIGIVLLALNFFNRGGRTHTDV